MRVEWGWRILAIFWFLLMAAVLILGNPNDIRQFIGMSLVTLATIITASTVAILERLNYIACKLGITIKGRFE